MEPFMIQATGSAEIPHLAERARVNVRVASSGNNKAFVSEQVITTAKHIEALMRELSPKDKTPESKAAAALAHWSKTSLSATSYDDMGLRSGGKTKEHRHYDASIKFDIRFQKFAELGAFGTKLSALPHVEVDNIEWMLTRATEKSYRSQLRKEAARDALQRAEDYCEALGCGPPRPVKLSEGDQFGFSNSGFGTANVQMPLQHTQHHHRSAAGFGSGNTSLFGTRNQTVEQGEVRNESELEFTPQTLRMSMVVTMEFHADSTTSGATAATASATTTTSASANRAGSDHDGDMEIL